MVLYLEYLYNRFCKDIPFIFLTEQKARKDRLRGLEIGGDDYITKPFDIQELRLRVRNSLMRVRNEETHNPITGLPEYRHNALSSDRS